MPLLQTNSRYQNLAKGINLRPGQQYEATEAEAEWLMNDAPGVFSVVEPPKAPKKKAPSKGRTKKASK